MKPVRTWILVANARTARIVEQRGSGHELFAEPGMVFTAEPPNEHADRAGTGNSIAGPAHPAVDMADPQEQADKAFAHTLATALSEGLQHRKFDRLVIVAGPHMLGLLRKSMPPEVAEKTMAELDKDLTAVPLDDLKGHLDKVLFV